MIDILGWVAVAFMLTSIALSFICPSIVWPRLFAMIGAISVSFVAFPLCVVANDPMRALLVAITLALCIWSACLQYRTMRLYESIDR